MKIYHYMVVLILTPVIIIRKHNGIMEVAIMLKLFMIVMGIVLQILIVQISVEE